MNLTTRGKWLSAIAAAVGAWVFFGPKDTDSVEVSRSAGHPAARTAAAMALSHLPRVVRFMAPLRYAGTPGTRCRR